MTFEILDKFLKDILNDENKREKIEDKLLKNAKILE